VLGHRGARTGVAENTLAAFEAAADAGADGIELDVRLNRSGDCVVLHDRTLRRVTGGRDCRDIEEVTSSELGRIEVGGQRIPQLGEVLRWAQSRGMRVNIELKPDVASHDLLVRRVAAQLLSWPAAPAILLSSLHRGVVVQLGCRLPQLARAWVVARENEHFWREPLFCRTGRVGINPDARLLTEARLRDARRYGRTVYAWTVNDPALALRLQGMGVDGIITDDPARIVAALL
jgi:glycerophosphoryl diester phosphodiesterase